jgi:hypothetical protein
MNRRFGSVIIHKKGYLGKAGNDFLECDTAKVSTVAVRYKL